MAKSKKKQEGVGMWVAIVVLFVLGAWPIALILLLVKLFGDDGKKKRTAAPPLSSWPAISLRAGSTCPGSK